MAAKKYYLGLDIGTDSVGFCVTDENYNIIKKHKVIYDGKNTKYYGNHVWGARLFPEAKDASARRTTRETRRRFQRRKWRIVLLQDIFRKGMEKVDPYFFDRLNNSAIHQEDRDILLRQNHLLFNGKEYTDHDFFKRYPTIYHLRLALMNQPDTKFDLREIYLALAHMIKYRGNFLHEGEMNAIGSDANAIIDVFKQIDDIIASIQEEENADDVTSLFTSFNCDKSIADSLLEAFKTLNKSGELSDAMIAAFKLTDLKKGDFRRLAFDLASGKTKKLSALFPDIEIEDEDAKISVDFSSDDFINKVLPNLTQVIGEDRKNLLLKLRELYDTRILANLLKGKDSISKAMVSLYETHKSQLAVLKDLIRRYNPDEYSNFFRKMTIPGKKKGEEVAVENYANYIGFNDNKGKRIRTKHATSQDALYDRIKKILPLDAAVKDGFVEKQEGDRQKLLEIKNSIEGKTYLLRQNSKDNGVLPYQLNLNEMRIILRNQSVYYPFLGEMDKDFNHPETDCYKIESILKFKIPYFVGPLSTKATHNWIVRKTDEKITPWNFHDVIDEEKTAEGFMENLKNYCTYLSNEPTLPKESLIYQMYVLLNEINKWKINGAYISNEDKQYIIEELYLKQKKVSKKSLEECLKRKYKLDVDLTSSGTTEDNQKGITNEDMHATLSSWIAFMDPRAFGRELLTNTKLQEKAEQIIYDITTFENQTLMKKRLKKYSLTESQIKYISALKFEGWARLSRKLLTGLKTDIVNQETGEVSSYSIMDLMWKTNMNFMEILTSKKESDGHTFHTEMPYRYDFMNQVEAINGDLKETIDDIIDHTYTSPMMKRALLQTIKIVEELKTILKIDHFDTYFVESTRSGAEKKRTKSRKKQIEEMYTEAVKKHKAEIDMERLGHLKENLSQKTDGQLKGKKLFLYFMQLGKSVYTGKEISLDELDKNYDIDHIIPQSKVKDDSFINTVLVEKPVNASKDCHYPIPKSIITMEGRNWVKTLNRFNPNLMPKEKMDRILRPESRPLTDSELSGFAQRQLVSTNQSVKAVCEVLKQIDPKGKVVYSKASNVSDFRSVFHLVKSREANDFHHAHDAYLNIVVGNVFNKLFSTGDKTIFRLKKEQSEGTNMSVEYIFRHDARVMFTGTLVWEAKQYTKDSEGHFEEIPESKGTIDLVRKYLSYQDPLVTQMMYTNVGKQGFFNKISIHTAKNADASYPLKATGPFAQKGFESKYGGYSDLTNPYASLVRSEGKKGKHIYSIEFVPTIARMTIGNDEEKMKQYLTEHNGLKNPEVLIEKLLMKTIIEIPYSAENGRKGNVRLGISGKSGNSIICINLSELHIPSEYMRTIKTISKLLGLNSQAGEKVDISSYNNFGNGDIKCTRGSITRDELSKLFDYLVNDVFCRPEYEGIPKLTGTITKLKNTRDSFNQMNTIDQMVILSSMLKLTCCKSAQGNNLSALGNGLPSVCGDIQFSNKLNSNVRIIQTSITGLIERVLFTVPED